MSLDLNSAGVMLEPGGRYSYSVTMTSAAGRTETEPQTFTTPENVVSPVGTTTPSTTSDDSQQGPSGTTSTTTGMGGSSSTSSTPNGTRFGAPLGKTTKIKVPTKAGRSSQVL